MVAGVAGLVIYLLMELTKGTSGRVTPTTHDEDGSDLRRARWLYDDATTVPPAREQPSNHARPRP